MNVFNPAWLEFSSIGCKKVLCFKGKPHHVSATSLQAKLSQTISLYFLCLLCHFALLKCSLPITVLHCTLRYIWDRVIDVGYSSALSTTSIIEGMCCICFITRRVCHLPFISPRVIELKKQSHLPSTYNRQMNKMVMPHDNPFL